MSERDERKPQGAAQDVPGDAQQGAQPDAQPDAQSDVQKGAQPGARKDVEPGAQKGVQADAPKGAPKGAPRDAPRDAPRGAPGDASKDASKDAPKDALPVASRTVTPEPVSGTGQAAGDRRPGAEPGTPPPAQSGASPSPESGAAPVPARRRSLVAGIALVLALIALALAALATYWGIERTRGVEEAAARRLQAADRATQDLSAQLRTALESLRATQESLRELQGRTALMESKLAEAAGQQTQLDRLLQEFSRSRGDRELAEVEQAVLSAARQLQWNGNVRGALASLQDADEMLARLNHPASLGIRRLISADLERVNALNMVDVDAWVQRLDAMLGQVEHLPLVPDLAPAEPGKAVAQAPSSQADAAGAPLQTWVEAGTAWWQRLVGGLGGMLRVHRVDQPDALLLAPDQGFYARENLRLSLAGARLALLARDQDWLRADLARASSLLERYFAGTRPAVKTVRAQLQQLAGMALQAELPSLAETLAAVRSARARSEAR